MYLPLVQSAEARERQKQGCLSRPVGAISGEGILKKEVAIEGNDDHFYYVSLIHSIEPLLYALWMTSLE